MCPKCTGSETGKFVNKREGVEEEFLLNKCHECDCVFLTFNFDVKGSVKSTSRHKQ